MLQLRGPGEIIIHFRTATLLLTPVYSTRTFTAINTYVILHLNKAVHTTQYVQSI